MYGGVLSERIIKISEVERKAWKRIEIAREKQSCELGCWKRSAVKAEDDRFRE